MNVATEEDACRCVQPLMLPADRLATLRGALLSEPEPVVALTHLLRLCRDEHATLWEHHADPRCRSRVSQLVADVADALPPAGRAATIDAKGRRAMAHVLTIEGEIPPVVVAHALAGLIDERYGHAFTAWFRRRSPYRPAVGDPIPLDRPDLRQFTALAPTAPPWRLANRLDETRRVRLAGAWTTQFQVVFDYSAFESLAGVIGPDTVIATCHPNRSLSELTFPADRSAPAFPVEPRNPVSQWRHVERLLTRASEAGASVAVLPELAVTEAMASRLERWVRAPGPLRLLIAGSHHHVDPDAPGQRANRALAWVRDHPDPLIAEKHSPADRPVAEDITPTGWPEIHIYVSADGWHVVIAICRDLLNPQAVHALAEVGANLVLAPAMSETLVAFSGPVAQLVGSSQAIVVVANNPTDWSEAGRRDHDDPPARALFGHPGFSQLTRQVRAPDASTGIGLLHVRTGTLGWYPDSSTPLPQTQAVDDRPGRPAWVDALTPLSASAGNAAPGPGGLRAAAVLVLLTDGADGPQALLTVRSADLADYPEQLVFPGGATEPGDRGPVETALREAEEEVGLDPANVCVIGTLPAFLLVESGFAVTPVVAWTEQPRFVHGPNPAEVLNIRTIAIRLPRDREPSADAPRIGTMTSAVLDLLAGRLARWPGDGRMAGSPSGDDRRLELQCR